VAIGPASPVGPAPPYDTFESVLNLTRVRINDAIVSLGGEVLTDNQPFTQEMAWAGWRALQGFLANTGMRRFRKRCILTGFPVVGNLDPSSETLLNWTFFYDGQSYFYPPQYLVLPQDFILPLEVRERVAGSNRPFLPMAMAVDGRLQQGRKRPFNSEWNWSDDGLYMPGSTNQMDLEIWYASYLPDPVTMGDVPWYQQPVPIMRAKNALANYIAAEFAAPRGDMDAATFIDAAEKDATLIFNVEVSMKQRVNVSRKGFSGRHRGAGRSCRY
jgi:hypothetical protein